MDKLVEDLGDCAQAYCISKTPLNPAQRSLMANLVREEIGRVMRDGQPTPKQKTIPNLRSVMVQAV